MVSAGNTRFLSNMCMHESKVHLELAIINCFSKKCPEIKDQMLRQLWPQNLTEIFDCRGHLKEV